MNVDHIEQRKKTDKDMRELYGLVRWLQWLHAGASVTLVPLRHGDTWSHLVIMFRDGKRTIYSYENKRLIPLLPRV